MPTIFSPNSFTSGIVVGTQSFRAIWNSVQKLFTTADVEIPMIKLLFLFSGTGFILLLPIFWNYLRETSILKRIYTSSYFYRIEYFLSNSIISIKRRRALTVLIFSWIVLNLHILLPIGGDWQAVFVNNFLSVLLTIVVAYVSADYLVDYFRYTERRRITDPDSIKEAYEEYNLDLIDMNNVEYWTDTNTHSRTAAATVEHEPDSVASVRDIELELSDEYYKINGCIKAIIEPEQDFLTSIFHQEGHYSGPLLRLKTIRNDTFRAEKTSYYRSFLTNFCPDVPLRSGKTLRELTAPFLFDQQGLGELTDSPLSDHLGIACLVITMDGFLFTAVRGSNVAVDQHSICLPVGGSASLAANRVNKDPKIYDFFHREVVEELKLEHSDEHDQESTNENAGVSDIVKELFYLGTIRRMERLGKPDTLAIAVVDADIDWSDESGEYDILEKRELPGSIELGDPSEVFDRSVVRSIISFYHDEIVTGNATPPTASLLSSLYFLYRKSK